MKSGLLTLPVLPLRAEPSEKAEQVTQLLFGDWVEVLDEKEDWLLVRSQTDEYSGWTCRKMLTEFTDEFSEYLFGFKSVLVAEPIQTFQFMQHPDETIVLPAGSRLYATDDYLNCFFYPVKTIDGYDLRLLKTNKPNKLIADFPRENYERPLLNMALRFMHAPYLWGGKTVLGMDCSGLVQLSAALVGFKLPRDAKDQILLGIDVPLSESKSADVAFFQNAEGRTVHVGLLLDNERILHASGSVRIDKITPEGIIHQTDGTLTHHLQVVKRIFYR